MTTGAFRFAGFTDTDMRVFLLFCKALVRDDNGRAIARVVDVRVSPEYANLEDAAFHDSVRFLVDRNYLRPVYAAAHRMAATYTVDAEARAIAQSHGLTA